MVLFISVVVVCIKIVVVDNIFFDIIFELVIILFDCLVEVVLF